MRDMLKDIEIVSQPLPDLDAFLSEQLYAFNCAATGVGGGEMLTAALEDESGVAAAVSGHTWGGTCEILVLWVRDDLRGQGLGSALLQATEREAVRRGCHQLTLQTHSFQAPRFYERRGYRLLAVIPNYPPGHDKRVYLKALPSLPEGA